MRHARHALRRRCFRAVAATPPLAARLQRRHAAARFHRADVCQRFDVDYMLIDAASCCFFIRFAAAAHAFTRYALMPLRQRCYHAC